MPSHTIPNRHRAGPWPGWLRWYRSTGGPTRDYLAWSMYARLQTIPEIARALGVSVSTVHRGIRREAQRLNSNWPPQISNGFGLTADQRNELRLRQLQQHDPYEENYQAPGEVELYDQEDDR